MARIEITVRYAGKPGTDWVEKLDVPEGRNPETYGAEIVEWFNSTRTGNEKEREFVASRPLDDTSEHKWEKQNLYTVRDRMGQYHDVHKCSRCGVTGKRYGIGGGIKRDRAFQAKKYERCRG